MKMFKCLCFLSFLSIILFQMIFMNFLRWPGHFTKDIERKKKLTLTRTISYNKIINASLFYQIHSVKNIVEELIQLFCIFYPLNPWERHFKVLKLGLSIEICINPNKNFYEILNWETYAKYEYSFISARPSQLFLFSPLLIRMS